MGGGALPPSPCADAPSTDKDENVHASVRARMGVGPLPPSPRADAPSTDADASSSKRTTAAGAPPEASMDDLARWAKEWGVDGRRVRGGDGAIRSAGLPNHRCTTLSAHALGRTEGGGSRHGCGRKDSVGYVSRGHNARLDAFRMGPLPNCMPGSSLTPCQGIARGAEGTARGPTCLKRTPTASFQRGTRGDRVPSQKYEDQGLWELPY